MTDISVVTAGTNGAPPITDAPPGSALAQLRAAVSAERTERTLELPVGGPFSDHLVVRYGGLPVGDLERYSELSGRLGNLGLAIDMAVSCCRTMLWRTDDGRTEDLEVRLGPKLWALGQWPLPDGMTAEELTPRQVVEELWRDRGMALGAHLTRLVEWQSEEERAPGESSGATS